MKWKYGDAWEKNPIEEGEVWGTSNGSRVAVHDLRNPLPSFLKGGVDMLYLDPPWNKGNVNTFVTKAELDSHITDFKVFLDTIFGRIEEIRPKVCYMEMGKQNLHEVISRMEKIFPHVQSWEITYYKKHPCYLVRGGKNAITFDFTGMDDDHTPLKAVKLEEPRNVADFVLGRGHTLVAAHTAGVPFLGTELNKRRIAVAIGKAHEMGIHYKPL